MVLESTVMCVDNSEFMRNGDYLPTRLQAQQDAANLICRSKLRSNPENNMALLSMSDMQVHVTLTTDSGKLLSKLNLVNPKGEMKFLNGLRVAHLALKHRQSKNHKTRIIMFVGSPIIEEDKEITKVAKKLKKEKVCVDVINFGEQAVNTDKLTNFINTLNGKEGGSSHLVTIPPGSMLSGAITTSPILVEEGGSSIAPTGGDFDLGFDPNIDPELALALRVSLEEQRHRQEENARKEKNTTQETQSAPATAGGLTGGDDDDDDEAALEMSMEQGGGVAPPSTAPVGQQDISSMTEDEQIAYALQMSMQTTPDTSVPVTPMQVDDQAEKMETDDPIADAEFLESVLQSLPGVDPKSDAVRQAMDEMTKDKKGKDGSKKQ